MKFNSKYLLGRKLNMTQVFSKEGIVHATTIVEAKPVIVTQIRTKEKDGYEAVQVDRKKEFKPGTITQKVGDIIDISQFKEGDNIEVSAISKGKGFQGVVKRHGFAGGPRTHGQKHSEREPGSIGGGLRNKVPKKMRMAGRMGSDRVTIKNLKVVNVNTATNMLYISGAIPGKRGTLVEIRG